MNRRGHGYRGFTLVEMMVVVILIAILMMVAIPVFQGANRGGRTRTAIFQINSTVSLARQLAITRRQNIHILFPDSEAPYDEETISMAYTSYALYGERDGYLSEWRELPPGVVFENEIDPRFPNEMQAKNIFLQTATYEKPVRFPRDTDPTNSILALTYRRDGSLLHAGINPKGIYIREGWIETPLGATTLDPDEVKFRPDATIFGVEIRPESGQARMREYQPEP